jgi:hypothetical protein
LCGIEKWWLRTFMAKAKRAKRKTRTKPARRRTPARKTKRAARAVTTNSRAKAAAGTQRIAELEAENARLREELAALRAEHQSDESRERPPALEL